MSTGRKRAAPRQPDDTLDADAVELDQMSESNRVKTGKYAPRSQLLTSALTPPLLAAALPLS